MAFGSKRRVGPHTTQQTQHHTTTTTTTKPTLMGRLRGQHTRKTTTTRPAKASRFGTRTRAAPRTTHATHGTHATPVTTRAAPRRKTSIGDKVSGAMMKLRGSLTRRPGVKAAGTRRMHGTDGRGSRRVY